MAKYLYNKTTGEWVFGQSTNDICPAGIFRMEIKNNKIVIRHNYNRDVAVIYASSATDFLKENGSAYASVSELITATKDFFAGKIPVTLGSSDIQIGAVELKDADADTRAKIAAGSSMAVGNNALAVADPNVKSSVDILKAKQFPENFHVLTGTSAAPAGTYKGFLVVEEAVISSISGVDTEKITGTNDFSGMTLFAGLYIPIEFTGITLTSGSIILEK